MVKLIVFLILATGIFVYCQTSEMEYGKHGQESSFLSSIQSHAHTIYCEDFENSSLFNEAHNIETGANHSLKLFEKPGNPGNKAARFELRDDDPNVKGSRRAEVTVVKDDVVKNMWYSFDIYVPAADYDDEKDAEVINQWHQSGMGTPATSLRIVNGRFELRTGNTADNRKKIDLGPVIKNSWHSFAIHMVHSHGHDGLIELWIDENLKVSRSGGNMYKAGGMPKWKIGIYKSNWDREKTETNLRVLYFDNVCVKEVSELEDSP